MGRKAREKRVRRSGDGRPPTDRVDAKIAGPNSRDVRQVVGGEGQEFLSEPLIAELSVRFGWDIAHLRVFRSRGAKYSRPRDSLLLFWGPNPEGDDPAAPVAEPHDAYISSFQYHICTILEHRPRTGEVSYHMIPHVPTPACEKRPDLRWRTVRCTHQGCTFRIRFESEGAPERQTIGHLRAPLKCEFCSGSITHVFVDPVLPLEEGPACTLCGYPLGRQRGDAVQ